MSAASPDEAGRSGGAAFPWDEAAGFAFGLMKMAPRDFWATTPRELAMMIAPFEAARPSPIDPKVFQALMERFPDGVPPPSERRLER